MWSLKLDTTDRRLIWILSFADEIKMIFQPRNPKYDTTTVLAAMSEHGGELSPAFPQFKVRIAAYHRGEKLAQKGRDRALIRAQRKPR